MNKDVKCALMWASGVAAWLVFFGVRIWEGNFGTWSAAAMGFATAVSMLPQPPQKKK